MNLDEFYEEKREIKHIKLTNEHPDNEIQVIENQLIITKQLQNKLIAFEEQKKAIEKAEKSLKQCLEQIMKENGITSYETNDKRIRISLGEDSTIESIDKDKLFMEYPDAYRECIKETKRKGTLRITIREEDNGEM